MRSSSSAFPSLRFSFVLVLILFVVSSVSSAQQLRAYRAFNDNAEDNARDLQSRIVGGTAVTNTEQYPFFVYWGAVGCGGTLIHPDVVLTAAHCWRGALGRVTFRMLDRNDNKDWVQVRVKSGRVHPQFNGDIDEPKWDFAVLFLERAVPSTLAKPIALHTNKTQYTTTTESGSFKAIGLGALRENAKGDSDTLQHVDVSYIPNYPSCYNAFDGNLIDAELCAGNWARGGQDACFGDSGGPLVDYSTGVPLQVGIVSWGDGCARKGLPGVYARVSTAATWIQAMICWYSQVAPLDDTSSFCHTTKLPLPSTLQVDIQYNGSPWDIAWGLYHIDSATTLYEQGNENGIDRQYARRPQSQQESDSNSPEDPPTRNRSLLDAQSEEKEEKLPTTSAHVMRSRGRDYQRDYQERKKDDKNKKDKDDDNKDTIFREGSSGLDLANTLRSAKFDDLEPGTYYFQIRDRRDSDQGMAWAKLIQGKGRELLNLEGGTFGGFYGLYFEIKEELVPLAEMGPNQETSGAEDIDAQDLSESNQVMIGREAKIPTVEMTVEVLYDDHPQDTSWQVFQQLGNGAAFKVIHAQAAGSVTESQLYSTTMQIPKDATYQFVLRDSSEAGVHGQRYIWVWIGNRLVFDSPGNTFTSALVTTIVV